MIAPVEMELQLDRRAILLQPDQKTIGRTFDHLSVPGSLIEVRHSIDGKWRTRCFRNDEREQFIEYVLGLPNRAKGVHATLNPVRLLHPSGKHTCDADIERRHWLLIDFDPKRKNKSKTNASDSEKAAAFELANWVREWISEAFKWRPQNDREWPSREVGWPTPIVADSGNGCHLLYPVDLPADEATDRLVDELLNQLSDLFSITAVDRFWNAAVDVDRTVGNAGQLTKLYGSVARKGEHSLDRPWRVSGLRHVPLCVRERLVTLELLRAAVRKLKSVNESTPHGADPPSSRTNGHTHQPRSDWSDVDKAEWALGRLPVLDYDDNYKEWVGVGMSLHSADQSPAMLARWVDWSCGSEKFEPGECETKWSSFKTGGGRGLGSLLKKAKDNSGEEFPWEQPRPHSNANNPNPSDPNNGSPDSDARWTSIRESEGRTDLAFARRFLAKYAKDVRYVPEWGTAGWLVWDGSRWAIDVGACRVIAMCQDVSDSIWGEVAQDRSDQAFRYAKAMSAPGKWLTAIRPAGSQLAIKAKDLNRDPWLFNCANGTLDLRTGELRPSVRKDLITQLCPTRFEREASAPTWERFIGEVSGSNPEIVQYLQRFTGWCLTGLIREHLLNIAWGEGANGKSTLFNTLMKVWGGDYATAAPKGLLVERRQEPHPTELARLFGMRLVVTAETEGKAKLAESQVKQLTGGDPILARRMREDFWAFEPTHKLVMLTNHRPRVAGDDHGIWRRLRLIPFQAQFDGGRADKTLPERLLAESSGILAWAVQGCMDWQQSGLEPCPEIAAATSSYRGAQDILGEWLAACCEQGEYTTPASVLYESLERYCRNESLRPPTRKALGIWLEGRRFTSVKSGSRKWQGLRLYE